MTQMISISWKLDSLNIHEAKTYSITDDYAQLDKHWEKNLPVGKKLWQGKRSPLKCLRNDIFVVSGVYQTLLYSALSTCKVVFRISSTKVNLSFSDILPVHGDPSTSMSFSKKNKECHLRSAIPDEPEVQQLPCMCIPFILLLEELNTTRITFTSFVTYLSERIALASLLWCIHCTLYSSYLLYSHVWILGNVK